jgi:prolyl oligopeptidase
MRFRTLAAGLATVVLCSCSTPSSTLTRAGMTNEDPYLWLEDIEGDRALAWVREHNERTLAALQGDQRFAGLQADALALANSHDRLPLGTVREGYYYNFWQDETHVRGVWRRSPLAAYAHGAPVWENLLDIDALAAAENANWVYKAADCLEGSTRCMIALSDGGRDASVWREFDLATRSFVRGGFELPAAKSSVAWVDADTLLVATDWGAGTTTESGYAFVVKRWHRGTPLASATEVMRGAHTDVGVFCGVLEDTDGHRLPIAVQATSFFESNTYRLDGAQPQRINLPAKANVQGLYRGNLLFLLQEDWRGISSGSLGAYPLEDTGAEAPRAQALFSPNARQSIEAVAVTHDAVLVAGFENVRGRLLRFTNDGGAWQERQIDLPTTGAVSIAGAAPTEQQAFAVYEDYLTPSTLYALDDRATAVRAIRSLPPQFDASPYVTEQFEAESSDGTRVPYFVLHRRDMALNGENPTLLYAGVYVLANIRGGGEFGPAWHQAGLRTHRQLIYDDFFAVERDLVQRRITSPRRLGIEGGSNGGLLMGVMLNQHPEMVHAAVVQVPLLDMLRFDQLLAGASWVDEYGSPSNPEERAFLEQTSPYQNLRRRPDFPTPFVLTSTKDDRVHPGHARKYVARMEELGMPVLYYENIDGGHSAAANLNEAARRRALEYTYLMQQLMD